MKLNEHQIPHGRSLVALAVVAVFGPAQAQTVEELSKPESSVSVGVGALSGNSRDRAQFGQYNGMRKDDFYGLLDFDYVNRDDATGLWTTFQGRNLGLDTRELRFGQQKQGDWKYSAEYGSLVRVSPYTVNTAMAGAGTSTPAVNLLAAPGTGSNIDLQLKRQSLTLSGEKWINSALSLEVVFKTEDKDGSRLFGRGFTCPSGAAPAPTCTAMAAGVNAWALLMLPEPVNSTTRQLDAKINYTSGKLNLSGGYYGSFYTNSNSTLTPSIPGALNNPLGAPTALNAGLQGILASPMALPPDNQAHQFFLSGNYGFTPTTRGVFKVAYTHATQHDNFLGMGLTGAPGGRSDLGGELNTTLVQLGVTSRPIPKLSLLANIKYEDRKDKTPDAFYNIEGVNTFTQSQLNLTKISAKLEGSYQLPANFRGTLGVDYDQQDRGQFSSPDSVAGLSGLRAKTDEIGVRAELRRTMSETLSGALSVGQSRRDGSTWLRPNTLPATGATPLSDLAIANRTAIFPALFMNRQRDRVKLMADWTPIDPVSLQFVVEDATDRYSAPTTKGLTQTGARLYSIDGSWRFAEGMQLTGYVARNEQVMNVAHSTGYIMALRNHATSAGLGLVGKPSERIQLGGNLSYINDVTAYDQTLDVAASATNVAFLAASGGLPNVLYRQIRMNIFGKYDLDKVSSIRMDLAHVKSTLSEWTWAYGSVPFAYSDNTTIVQNPHQSVSLITVSYAYKFR